MTYTVSSGTLNSSIPYHTIPYRVSCKKHEVQTKGSCRPKCRHTEKQDCSGEADIQPRRPATHHKSREMGLSQCSVVVITCYDLGLKKRHAQELSEATRHAFIMPDLWSPNSHDPNPVNYIWRVIQQRVYQTKVEDWMVWGSVWLMCGLEWNPALLTMPCMTHCTDIHVNIWARRGHSEYLLG